MMSEPNQENGVGAGPFQVEGWVRWGVLGLGLLLAGLGGGSKVSAVAKDPQLFEYVFFSGATFIAMVCGLVLVIVSIGYPLLFGPDTDSD